LEPTPPTYYAGDTIKVTFVFEGAPGIRSVTATFRHEEEADAIDLVGDAPTRQSTAGGGQSYWQTELEADLTADNPAGVYVCESIVAEYRGGRTVPFIGIPNDDRFRVELENIPNPRGTTWDWSKGSSEGQDWELW
jgi:hypothetical protein